jgi:tight adherence protein B
VSVTVPQLVFALLAAASLTLMTAPAWRRMRRGAWLWFHRSSRHVPAGATVAAPSSLLGRHRHTHHATTAAQARDSVKLVRQLAALLEAGRSGSHLWEEALIGRIQNEARAGPDPHSTMLELAQSVAALGLSPSAAFRRGHEGSAAERLSPPQLRFWQNLGACLDFSEHSGAPLAALLWRYASALEDDLDAEAVRRTALAGPRASTRLLTALPILALLLGILMGIDPVGVLLGQPLGWTAAATGLALMALGRWWSSFLLRAATRQG